MIRSQAVWQTIMESRQYLDILSNGGKAGNNMLHRYLDIWFFEFQLMAVRRLCDPEKDLTGKLSVYSFKSLLSDMEAYRKYLTRENIFNLWGIEYCYENTLSKEKIYRTQMEEKGEKAYHIPDIYDPSHVKYQHKLFDDLSGTSSSNRSPNDLIKDIIFTKIKEKIVISCEVIKNYVDKYYAHAASPESRAIKDVDDYVPRLSDLFNAQKTIGKAANFIGRYLFNMGEICFSPALQYNQFKYLDHPIVKTENIKYLKEKWENYANETNSWANCSWLEYQREFFT